METKLYQYWRSSCSWRVRWALAIKHIPFESVILNIVRGDQTLEDHKARSPVGHVPALFIQGKYLAESVAIIQFLDDYTPEPNLFPKDPWKRARVMQVVELVNSGVQPLQNLIVLRKVSDNPDEQKKWAHFFNQRGMQALESLLNTIDEEFGKGTFAVGNTLTAADLFVVPQVYSARRFGVDLSPFPRVLAAEQAALATEFADSARPENQPDAPKQ